MMKLYGGKKTRSFRVLWTLEELGQPYEFIPAPPHSDDVRPLNPSGKVPVLVTEEGETLWDSVAIMTWLADRHATLTHAPGTALRAQQDGLTQTILDEMDALLWTAARHSFILPEEKRVPEVKPVLKWEYSRNLATFAKRMDPDGPFVMGETMTIPDILLAQCTGWAEVAGFEVSEPRIAEHARVMRERPAFARAAAA